MFVSEYLNVDLDGSGVFDALLDKDSNFFINIVCLKQTTVPEFRDAYRHLNKHFADVATLLDASDDPSMKNPMYRTARKMFEFHEVNGVNLGFAKSTTGAGWGDVTSDKVLRDAYQIVKKGSKQPEIFHLVGLFEEKVSGDRLSDMIATIIEPDIKRYTLRILTELGVEPASRPHLQFDNEGFVVNPFKKCPLLLLPEEILNRLPIARDWYELDRVAEENRAIKREMSAQIGEIWEKWASARQKRYLREQVFMNPEACERVIDDYRMLSREPFNLKEDPDYLAECLLRDVKVSMTFATDERSPSSMEATLTVVGILKDWVENNRGWEMIQDSPTRKREKAVQRLLHLAAKHYVETNDIDLTFEADAGRGPVDLKLSRGSDKTIAEVKLSSSSQYIHGYEVQVEEYARAERTANLVYVLVDVGNPGKVSKLKRVHEENRRLGKGCPELVIVDARPRSSASIYMGDASFPSNIDFDWSLPGIIDSPIDVGFKDTAALELDVSSILDGLGFSGTDGVDVV